MAQLQTILSTLSQLKASIEAIETQVRQMANPFVQNTHTNPFVQQAARDAVGSTLPRHKLISPFATYNHPILGTPNKPILGTPNQPILGTPNQPIPPPNTPSAPVKPMNIRTDSPILSVGQASDFLRNCTFSLSSLGYRLKEPSFEVRKKCLQKAVEKFTYPEVILKLYSLWFVWKENGVQVYVDRLEQDIQEVKRNRIHVQPPNPSKVHLSPYGYSIKEPQITVRFKALHQARQVFPIEHIVEHLNQIKQIWESKLSFAKFRKNTEKINEYSQYVERLELDQAYVMI